jgi:hypothetical protein
MNTLAIRFSVLLFGGACAACNPYPRLEADFGESVRHMVTSQQVNPDATEAEPVLSGDAQRIDRVLGVYRTDVSQPSTSQQQPVTLQIGSTTTTAQ